MSEFKNKSITNKGMELLTKAFVGKTLEFTKIEIGSGKFEGDIGEATELIELRQLLPITNISRKGSQVTLSATLKSGDIQTSFEWSEIGVYAKGHDGVEVLYMYGYTENTSYISKDSLNEKLIHVTVMVSNVAEVTAKIDESLVYLTQEALKNHDVDQEAHKHMRDEIKSVQSQLNNIDISWEGITGKPMTFPPENHMHSDITQSVSTLESQLRQVQVPWGRVTEKPTLFPPATHTHNYAPNGFGLGMAATGLTDNDWNNALNTGFYMGVGAKNAPDGDWWMGYSIMHNPAWVVQVVNRFSNGQMWKQRFKMNGLWSEWKDFGGGGMYVKPSDNLKESINVNVNFTGLSSGVKDYKCGIFRIPYAGTFKVIMSYTSNVDAPKSTWYDFDFKILEASKAISNEVDLWNLPIGSFTGSGLPDINIGAMCGETEYMNQTVGKVTTITKYITSQSPCTIYCSIGVRDQINVNGSYSAKVYYDEVN